MSDAQAPLRAFSACGIELEYMIVERGSLAVWPVADLLLRDAGGGLSGEVARGACGWSNELVAHVLELKGRRPVPDLRALAADFEAEVRWMDALAARHPTALADRTVHSSPFAVASGVRLRGDRAEGAVEPVQPCAEAVAA